jgi:hypothetical protein
VTARLRLVGGWARSITAGLVVALVVMTAVGLVRAQHLVFTGPCERSRRLLALIRAPFYADPASSKADAHVLGRSLVTDFRRAELTEDADARLWLSGPVGLPDNVTYRSEDY